MTRATPRRARTAAITPVPVPTSQANAAPAGKGAEPTRSRYSPRTGENTPWLPGQANSALEHAVYDPDSRMLRGFLGGLRERLAPGGEGWLVLSDLAEHLGLRSRDELLALLAAGGLVVLARLDVRPRHPKASDASDPLAAARSREVTSLWRLVAA